MNEHNRDIDRDNRSEDLNPDPITGAPGSHPVGAGVGAAGAGAAGAAIGGAVGGPVGAVVGAVVGGVAGGYGGKAAAEAIDPTAEEAYWRENHRNQPYANRDADDYNEYAPAYETGYRGYGATGDQYSSFEEAEPTLRSNYERTGASKPWSSARDASRSAWERVGTGTAMSSGASMARSTGEPMHSDTSMQRDARSSGDSLQSRRSERDVQNINDPLRHEESDFAKRDDNRVTREP